MQNMSSDRQKQEGKHAKLAKKAFYLHKQAIAYQYNIIPIVCYDEPEAILSMFSHFGVIS